MKRSLIPWKSNSIKRNSQTDIFSEFQNHVNSFFDGFFEDSMFMPEMQGNGIKFNPKFDVVESKSSYEVIADMAGLSEKDVEVSVDHNVLTVKGEKSSDSNEEKKNYYISERSFGKFERHFELADNVDMDHIKASFKNGELIIFLPKKETAASKVKKIAINH